MREDEVRDEVERASGTRENEHRAEARLLRLLGEENKYPSPSWPKGWWDPGVGVEGHRTNRWKMY